MGLLSAKLQEAVQNHPVGSNRPKPIWTNPQENYDGFRLLTGDFDSTAFKLVHVPARQVYPIGPGTPTPLTYVNPDSLGVKAWYTAYRAATVKDTMIGGVLQNRKLVLGNDSLDYLRYRDITQNGFFGTFREKDNHLGRRHRKRRCTAGGCHALQIS